MAQVTSRAADYEDDEEEEYVKPPMSRGKKVLLCLFLFVVILMLMHWGWGRKAGNSLNAQVAQYRAKGEPVFPEDFNAPALSYEQNAATDILAAVALMNFSAEEQKLLWNQWGVDTELTPDRMEALRKLVRDHDAILDEIAKARGKPGADWGVQFRSPLLATLLPHLNKQREVAMFTLLAADVAHRDGDEAAALRLLDDVQNIGDAVGSSSVLVNHLVSVGISAGLTTDFVFRNAHELRIDGAPDAPPGKGAKRADVEAAIKRFLDDSRQRAGLRRAFYGERAMQYDTVQQVAQGKMNLAMLGGMVARPGGGGAPNLAFTGPLLKPIFYRDALVMMRMTTRAMDAAEEPNVAAAKVKADFNQVARLRGNPLHILSSMMLPAFENVLERSYRTILARRMAATLLALRLYQLDQGRLPDTLDQLVPKYLPAVPADPFSPDNKPISFVAKDGTMAVYSVGVNLKDEGGDSTPTRKVAANQQPDPWTALDVVIPFRPAPRLQPAEDEETEVDPLATPATAPATRPASPTE